MTKKVIELIGVTKIFNKALEEKAKTAVNNLSFSVEEGGITGFVGPNGAGKTTSIKMILGLYQPTKGQVKLMGKDATTPQARQQVAYVSEQPYFYEHLSAEETLAFVYQLKGLPKEFRERSIKEVLDIVELTPHRKGRVKKFSKGMQMRLNMAQALLGDPKLIIMDEPMSGLDPLGRRLFRKLFKQLADKGVTIFFSTHVIEDIETICDRIVVLSKGELYYMGEVATLVQSTRIGTEYHLPQLSPEISTQLAELTGITIITNSDNSLMVQTTEDTDKEKLSEILHTEKILPLAIHPLQGSLEEVLYADATHEEVA